MEHDFLGCSSGKFPGAMFQIPVPGKMKCFRSGSFKKQALWSEAMHFFFFTILAYKLIGYTLYWAGRSPR